MKLLFTSGTARGGTNFRTLMLNNHPNIQMSLDPFIPLFRFYRDSLLRSVEADALLARRASSVLDDYYFSDTKLAIMKALRAADPDIPFDQSAWPALKAAIAARMQLASVNLIPFLDKLPAPTFRDVFHNTTRVVASVTDRELVWCGFNDNWAMEFFPMVARLIPDARFILHLRDPRAVVYSSEFSEPDPAKRPTVASFARHLRKYAAFAPMLMKDAALRERLLVTYYEPFVTQPHSELRRVTEFLGIDGDPAMSDVDRFRKADGTPWGSGVAIYQDSTDVWRREMPRPMAELTEFICDPEMRLHGYEPEVFDADAGLSGAAFDFARRNAIDCLGWRTDFDELERTIGSELYRRRLLEADVVPAADVERCFLFVDVFEQVRQLARG